MNARAERWSQPDVRAALGAVALLLFFASWVAIHHGFWSHAQIVDTGVYRGYGDRIVDRHQVPYRDFDLEYPPGALPVFVLPSLATRYSSTFDILMMVLGAAAVFAAAAVSARAALFVAISPLLVGSMAYSRFDLWPAALTVAAIACLVGDRHRIGWGILGAAVAAKVYPVVLVGPALVWTWRRARARDALVGLVVLAAIVLPFAVIAPGGVWHSVHVQAGRPLQIETLPAAFLTTFSHPRIDYSHGSQNIAGHAWLGTLAVAVQVAAVLAIWLGFLRRPDELPRAAAASVAAFVAFGKVLSPQFLIWLVPLVPLVRGRRGVGATALLTAALVLTQVWFPSRYWPYAREFHLAWVVLLRDLVLVALVAALALNGRMGEIHPSGFRRRRG